MNMKLVSEEQTFLKETNVVSVERNQTSETRRHVRTQLRSTELDLNSPLTVIRPLMVL